LKLNETETEYCVIPEEELSLSGEAMAELLQASLDRNAPFKFKARGFSMSPFIKNGDVVTISPLLDYSIGFGKLAAFIHPQTGKLVIHRIVGQNGNRYLIKGDRSTEADGLIPRKNILGAVTRVERGDRKVRIGMGLERYIIVFLSRTRILSCLAWIWKKIISFSSGV